MVEAPIFHVNGDDPEAVVHAAKVAIEFRQKFGKDVVIDMFCYRRFGHNEGDEPMFTNPIMYKKIKHPEDHAAALYRAAGQGRPDPRGRDRGHEGRLPVPSGTRSSRPARTTSPTRPTGWTGAGRTSTAKGRNTSAAKTAIKPETLAEIGTKLTTVPDGFNIHKTVARAQAKKADVRDRQGFDWATAEALAFGSLLTEGYPVRLSGQDSDARHLQPAAFGLHRPGDRGSLLPAQQSGEGQAKYEVIDSMLSEYAVLGFEYGYSLAEPNALTLWEAQFGDFANGAQIMFDQFISSGERKWLRMSGLVMLLPHGFEGQGPEHSSARLERFLQMCAEDNWIVANCTTPANYFHILRRQLHRDLPQAAGPDDAEVAAAAQAGDFGRWRISPPGRASTASSGTTRRRGIRTRSWRRTTRSAAS
jgi:2-oxoglutarate dehydrogenase E1 component